MTSRRKARRKFSQWVRYFAHYYGVQTYATPGMLRAYDMWVAANRGPSEWSAAELYRATLAYAEAQGGPEALDELTGFTAQERRQLMDRRHDGRGQELRVGQVLLREQQRAAHLLPVRPGCQTRDTQVQVRRTKEVRQNERDNWMEAPA